MATLDIPTRLAVISLIVLTGCAGEPRDRAPASAANASVADATLEAAPPRTSIPDVMRAKLAHAQAVLEGLALADFPQIEVNASDLHQISTASEWLVMETVSYHAYSEEFRRITSNLVEHARAKDLHAVTADYAALTHSCISCHTYLRAERPFLNIPGRVSMK